jgi:hypothetical protein
LMTLVLSERLELPVNANGNGHAPENKPA